MLKEEKILGVKINKDLSMSDVVSIVDSMCSKKSQSHLVCTTNPEIIMSCQEDADFMNIVNNAALSLADGIGVILAEEYMSRLSKYTSFKGTFYYYIVALYLGICVGFSGILNRRNISKRRITGRELSVKLVELCATRGYNVFLLGGRYKKADGTTDVLLNTTKDLATEAAQVLRQRYPNLNVIGATSRFNRDQSDDVATCDYIHKCMIKANCDRIDLLLVAYNHNYQEKWIIRNASSLPATVSVGVGSVFDYLTGFESKSPSLFSNMNLDWLYRLFIHPWRISRIFKAFPLFPLKVFVESLK